MTSAVCTAWVPEPTSRLISGFGQAQILKQLVVHILVVVLPGMDKQGRQGRLMGREGPEDGAIFMKLGRAPTTQMTGPRSLGQLC